MHRWNLLLGKFVYRGRTDGKFQQTEHDFAVTDKHTPHTVYIHVGKQRIPVYHAQTKRQHQWFKSLHPNQRYVA